MILTAKTVTVIILRKLQLIIFCSETEQIKSFLFINYDLRYVSLSLNLISSLIWSCTYFIYINFLYVLKYVRPRSSLQNKFSKIFYGTKNSENVQKKIHSQSVLTESTSES